MSEPVQITPRPVALEAFRWDGSEACAQAIALWLVERDGRDAWETVAYHRKTYRTPALLVRESDGQAVLMNPGDWLVRAYGVTTICDQETFDHYFTVAPTLQILESS